MVQPLHKSADAPARPFSFWERLKEIDMFFEGRGKEHKTMRRLVKNLEKAKIPYAIIGAMAVNAHRYERTTNDVDVLLTPTGFAEFRRRFVPKTYDLVAGRPRRFLKLAARRHRDLGDVVELIRFNNLDEAFLSQLHAALHRDFIECLEEKRREDEYEAHQDQEMEKLEQAERDKTSGKKGRYLPRQG